MVSSTTRSSTCKLNTASYLRPGRTVSEPRSRIGGSSSVAHHGRGPGGAWGPANESVRRRRSGVRPDRPPPAGRARPGVVRGTRAPAPPRMMAGCIAAARSLLAPVRIFLLLLLITTITTIIIVSVRAHTHAQPCAPSHRSRARRRGRRPRAAAAIHPSLPMATSGAPEIKLETPGFDARFPNTNQTKNCWQNYIDYHKCVKAKGEVYAPCQQFYRTYRSLCPDFWVRAGGSGNAAGPHGV